jgi:hypothetical protein
VLAQPSNSGHRRASTGYQIRGVRTYGAMIPNSPGKEIISSTSDERPRRWRRPLQTGAPDRPTRIPGGRPRTGGCRSACRSRPAKTAKRPGVDADHQAAHGAHCWAMEYHEAFWVTVGTAAPVIGLTHAVALWRNTSRVGRSRDQQELALEQLRSRRSMELNKLDFFKGRRSAGRFGSRKALADRS